MRGVGTHTGRACGARRAARRVPQDERDARRVAPRAVGAAHVGDAVAHVEEVDGRVAAGRAERHRAARARVRARLRAERARRQRAYKGGRGGSNARSRSRSRLHVQPARVRGRVEVERRRRVRVRVEVRGQGAPRARAAPVGPGGPARVAPQEDVAHARARARRERAHDALEPRADRADDRRDLRLARRELGRVADEVEGRAALVDAEEARVVHGRAVDRVERFAVELDLGVVDGVALGDTRVPRANDGRASRGAAAMAAAMAAVAPKAVMHVHHGAEKNKVSENPRRTRFFMAEKEAASRSPASRTRSA